MKKLKTLFGFLIAVIIIKGTILLSTSQTNDANAQVVPGEEEPCGWCVTPTESYPYPDDESDFQATNCTEC